MKNIRRKDDICEIVRHIQSLYECDYLRIVHCEWLLSHDSIQIAAPLIDSIVWILCLYTETDIIQEHVVSYWDIVLYHSINEWPIY
jgi:hypothetical protein